MNHPTISPTDPFQFEKESEHSITKWRAEGIFAFQSPLCLTREDLGPAFVQRNTTIKRIYALRGAENSSARACRQLHLDSALALVLLHR